jgi:DNA-binding MarR family transcriptional regulator
MKDSPCPFIAAFLGALYTVEERLEAALEPLGLSLAKYKLLAQLVEAGEPMPLGTLADKCACVRSNITQLVDRLEADKLVVRNNDPRDRRSVRAELTPEGRARHDAALQVLKDAERSMIEPLNAQQQNELLAHLAVIRGTV